MEDSQRRRVTRQDVARYAGVSNAVISYVINSGPRNVAPATREKVLEAIRVLDYRPNAAARALKLGSTELLGLVVPDATNPYFAELARAVEQAADEKGYALLLTSSALDTDRERKLLKKLISRQVDGLLLASMESNPDLSAVSAANIPVVLLDRSEASDGIVAVGVNYRAASRMGVQHLIGHGHTNIGLVVGNDNGPTAIAREQGWLDALHEARLSEGPIARAEFSRVGGLEAGKRLLNRDKPPTAVFVSSDMQAVGVLRALHEAGARIPEDVAVVSFDGTIETEFSWPPLTAVRQPTELMAGGAIKALVDPASQRPGDFLTFPTQLVTKTSCGCHLSAVVESSGSAAGAVDSAPSSSI